MDRLNIQSPEEFYGFKMGSDRKLARWDKIVEYFNPLSKASNRIRVTELGKSTGQTLHSRSHLISKEPFQDGPVDENLIQTC